MQYGDLKTGDEILIYSKHTGYLIARSGEDKEEFSGPAFLDIGINQKNLPGISSMCININEFDVWKSDNVDALRTALKSFLKPQYEH